MPDFLEIDAFGPSPSRRPVQVSSQDDCYLFHMRQEQMLMLRRGGEHAKEVRKRPVWSRVV